MHFPASLLLLALCSAPVTLATLYTTFPISTSHLPACSTQRITWIDNGQAPLLSALGGVSVQLMRGDEILIHTLSPSTIDPRLLALSIHLSCALTPASDYYIRYTPSAPLAAIYSARFAITAAIGQEPHGNWKEQRSNNSSRHNASETETGTETGTHTPTHRTKSAHRPSLTSSPIPTLAPVPAINPSSSPSPLLNPYVSLSPGPLPSPTTANDASLPSSTSGAAPSRGIGVHPGLVWAWAAVMCCMMLV